MATIIDTLRNKFSSGTMLIKLIFINIGVFVLLRLASVIIMLMGGDAQPIMQWLEMPSDPATFITRPWTIITYMFCHYDIMHILFNMLWLYWFGQIFLMTRNARQMFALYIYGGIGGALLYLLAFNIFPYFQGVDSYMLGASASVIAIVVATAMLHPDFKLNLLLIGQVSLKWIAIITIAIDLLSITSANAGGHIAHIGGGIIGYLFVVMLKRGRDITIPFNRAIDSIVNHAKGIKSPLKAKASRTASSNKKGSNPSAKSDQENLDEILDKIKKSGYSSLTSEERDRLFNISRRIK